jgi:hypothetical protein
MVDVSGQQNERRKWIHGFEGVEIVLFVASLNDFDLSMDEDASMVLFITLMPLYLSSSHY